MVLILNYPVTMITNSFFELFACVAGESGACCATEGEVRANSDEFRTTPTESLIVRGASVNLASFGHTTCGGACSIGISTEPVAVVCELREDEACATVLNLPVIRHIDLLLEVSTFNSGSRGIQILDGAFDTFPL